MDDSEQGPLASQVLSIDIREILRKSDWRVPMATGAGEQYWEQQMLPSVFKHDLLRRYLPRFSGKTGSGIEHGLQ